MKRHNVIIDSPVPPKSDAIWLDGSILKHLTNGKWSPIGQSSEEDRKELESKVDGLDKEVGEIKKGVDKLNSYQTTISLQIGNSTDVQKANLSSLQAVQSNDHTFIADINYGYGTGSWLPNSGGNATIFTDEGHAVFYTITSDGSVTKTGEMTLGSKASSSSDGLMSKEDKTKLDSLIQVPSGGSTGQVLKKTASGVAWQNDNNTTYSVATTSANGLMSSADKTKLEGIATNANNYVHPTTAGNKHVPAGGASGQILTWNDAGTATWGAIPTASSNTVGGVKAVVLPALLAEDAELADVITQFNALITALSKSGIQA